MPIGEITYVGFLALYPAIAASAAWVMWRLTGRISVGPMVRLLVRTTVLAFLFAPTFMACGAAAPTPFLLILVADLFLPNNGCSPNHYLVYWNAECVVAPTWLLIAATLELAQVLKRRASSNYRLERP